LNDWVWKASHQKQVGLYEFSFLKYAHWASEVTLLVYQQGVNQNRTVNIKHLALLPIIHKHFAAIFVFCKDQQLAL
jgi:hypothetical protein